MFPADVLGLPADDPIVLLEAGMCGVVAVTASGLALGWGWCFIGGISRFEDGPGAVRIAALSGCRLRSLACGFALTVAETESGALLCWSWGDEDAAQPPLPAVDGNIFPLRCLVAADWHFAYADAVGRVWHQRWMPTRSLTFHAAGGAAAGSRSCLRFPWLAELPEQQRAVRVATTGQAQQVAPVVVALTECGELWECSELGPCRSISAAQPELPRGLLPYGGPAARRILLVQDSSGGKARLVLFARIAMRIGVPSDPVRELLPPFVVHEAYITGPASDPFSISGDSGVGGGEERSEEGDGPDEA
eukprot:TRINITY_DN14952_c0_g1_i4.p1 TRINITY_DN14952_c0_g1~~TRINITY_DN14952_c0_g1_i4.p1  ORF type:complete len:305 (+),score=53.75 TRINITY_DN14952_c0_g1_i4:600-1514(+)